LQSFETMSIFSTWNLNLQAFRVEEIEATQVIERHVVKAITFGFEINSLSMVLSLKMYVFFEFFFIIAMFT